MGIAEAIALTPMTRLATVQEARSKLAHQLCPTVWCPVI